MPAALLLGNLPFSAVPLTSLRLPVCAPLQAQLAAHKAEAEASACRSMQFIERIMADKDALSGKPEGGRLPS